jgi:1,5-anhydro-D-fructose reductase (1,5-anhydro-D-mannitol-forming)
MILGWAILGTGRFAAARIAPALNRARGCRAVAVISRDRSRAEAFAAEYGIPQAYDSLQAALTDPAIEAVWVATPHALHRDFVLACARAGRHILCEKPLATTVEDAAEMIRASQQAGVRLGTGYHLRHHPLHIEVRRLLGEGRGGAVVSADAEWSLPPRADNESADWRWDPAASGGGIFTGTGVHALDLLRFVLDDEIESVLATMDPPPSTGIVERRAACILRFRRGAFGVVRCYRGVRATSNDLVVECQSGAVRVRNSLDEQARGSIELTGVGEALAGLPAGSDLYALQAEAFARSIAEGIDPNASGTDGLRVTEATIALYESAATGRAVRLAPD